MSNEEHECDCPPEGAPPWMATFSDMATLMLCFFVLLLSFANMDMQNFRTALGSVREAMGVQFKVNGKFEAMSTSPVELSDTQSSSSLLQKEEPIGEEAMAVVQEFVKRRGMADDVEVGWGERGVIVRMKDRVLFQSGRAEIKEHGFPVLNAIHDLAQHFDGKLVIEGHTDNVPIHNAEYPSNWELSAARASAVLRYLISDGIDQSYTHVAGYAYLRPVAGNDTPEGRARNRRVEFVFEHNEKYDGRPRDAFKLPADGSLASDLTEDDEMNGDDADGDDTNGDEVFGPPLPEDVAGAEQAMEGEDSQRADEPDPAMLDDTPPPVGGAAGAAPAAAGPEAPVKDQFVE